MPSTYLQESQKTDSQMILLASKLYYLIDWEAHFERVHPSHLEGTWNCAWNSPLLIAPPLDWGLWDTLEYDPELEPKKDIQFIIDWQSHC